MAAAWNHNIHYHDVVLCALPVPCRLALDVGCGEGVLTRHLAGGCDAVVGIDLEAKKRRVNGECQHATAP